MKITQVKAVYPHYRHVAPSWRTHLWQIVVRVEADGGLCGWGFGGGGEAAVAVVNGHMRESLLGQEVDGVEGIARIWDALYRASAPYGRRGIGVMGLSGVDLALWDLLGKAENKSVCELLGGARREKVRAYATGMDVEWYRDLGFSAHKGSHRYQGREDDGEKVVAWAQRARRVLGPEALLMNDGYMSWDADFSRAMARELQPYGVHWFEDVLLPDQVEEQAALRPAIKPVLLAGGEHEFTHFGFAELARAGALDIWQPDLAWCGGMTAALRIVAQAARSGVQVVPHRGGEVWGLHLIAAGLCEDLAELVLGGRTGGRDQVWLGEPEPLEGCLGLPDGPGFGVRFNEDML